MNEGIGTLSPFHESSTEFLKQCCAKRTGAMGVMYRQSGDGAGNLAKSDLLGVQRADELLLPKHSCCWSIASSAAYKALRVTATEIRCGYSAHDGNRCHITSRVSTAKYGSQRFQSAPCKKDYIRGS